MIPVIYPLHPRGGKFGDDTELRFSLRSIQEHFKGDCEVVIVGPKRPFWLQNVKHLYAEGLKSALAAAAKACPAGFVWIYDDCCLLRDTTAEEIKVTPACANFGGSKTAWGRKCTEVRDRLRKEGHPVRDYSRPHGPYWFDKSMVDEGFADWPGMKGKMPWESWILSKRDWPWRQGMVRQYYGPFRSPPGPASRYLNYNDKGNTGELLAWLRDRFKDQSIYESVPEMTKEEAYDQQADYLFAVWEKAGRPPLRSVCECAVGPYSLVAGFREVSEKSILIEPAAKFAKAAREKFPWATVHQVAITEKVGKANLRNVGGSSYVKGIPWAPIFTDNPTKARKANKQAVRTTTFDLVDDGRIDLLNLDCEGSEWYVLKRMLSRPRLIQIEWRDECPFIGEIRGWFAAEGYEQFSVYEPAPNNITFIRKSP